MTEYSRIPPAKHGEDNPRSKLTDAIVLAIRKDLASGMSSKDVSIAYGISLTTVYNVKHRRTWRHVKLDPNEQGKQP